MDVLMDVERALATLDVGELLRNLGWQTVDVPMTARAWTAWGFGGEVPPARVVANVPGCRVIEVRGALQRALVVAVQRRSPLETVLWFFVDGGEVCLAMAERTADGVRVRTMSVDPERPDAMGLERLAMLDLCTMAQPREADPSDAIAAHVAEMLDSEGLTQAFFDGFREALRRMADTVVDGPRPADDRWQVALVALLRLVFVYFLQREGMLDGDRRFIARRLRASDGHFYERVLRPLFFGVLNTPPSERDALGCALGAIPFLNGGLFEPTPLEVRHPQLHWADDVIVDVVEGLFERFHFTATEPTGADDARVVDPEMLGKVFEGLMYGDERRRTGSFYTPRDLVRDMVETTLDAYLEDRADDGVGPDEALETVRILDPAVGTGAFLLEALASLRRRRAERGLPVDYAALRRVVHTHLYGVDRNPTAVRLCELRLWLVMLSAMRGEPEIAPLPNLSHRIVAGDTLLDGVDLVRGRAGALHPEAIAALTAAEAHLEEAQRRFLEAHGPAKHALRREIAGLERDVQLRLVDGRRALLERRREPLAALVESPDLFGDAMATAEQRAALERLTGDIATLDELERRVREDRTTAPGFGYESRFGAVAREGFDVILTNPPWMRARHADSHPSLRTRYEAATGELWPGASELGIATPYGAQPDLAALFVERSLELLRPGGRLCALVPAKLFRALGASPLRRLLGRHRIERIDDLADSSRRLFDATVYPGILHVRKGQPEGGAIDVRVHRGDGADRFRRAPDALSATGAPGEPWLLVPDGVWRALDLSRRQCRPLGTVAELAPRRGIFTGANDVFVRRRGEFEAAFGPFVRPFVRPLLTGSALGDGEAAEVLYCYDGAAPLTDVPRELAAFFERHRERLERRSDHDPALPLWQLFRVREDTTAPKVAWRDIARHLEPVVLDSAAVPANTVYYVTFDDPAAARGFARWMESAPVRAWAYALAEHARGGWRRHFAWVVRMLPVPRLPGGWASFDDAAFGLSAADEGVLCDWLTGGALAEAA